MKLFFRCLILVLLSFSANAAGIEGLLSVGIIDLDSGEHTYSYVLKEKTTGTYYEITGENLPDLKAYNSKMIRVFGSIDEASGLIRFESLDKSFVPQAVGALSVSANFSGTRNILVVPVFFSDKTFTLSKADTEAAVFGATNSVKALYSEASFGTLNFTGIVTSPVTIPVASTEGCKYTKWISEAGNQVKADGYKLTDYKHKMYIVAKAGCSWVGLAGMNSDWSVIHNAFSNLRSTMAHEIGHNLTFGHASTSTEYGDSSDIMGGPGKLRLLNGPHMVQAGWANATLVGSGTYTLAPLALNPQSTSKPQVLKIPKPNSSTSFYYVSFRQPIGIDANLPAINSTYTRGAHVHEWAGATLYAGTNSYRKAILADEGTFVDPTGQLTITQIGHDPNSLTVRVELAGSNPPPPPPPEPEPEPVLKSIYIESILLKVLTGGGK